MSDTEIGFLCDAAGLAVAVRRLAEEDAVGVALLRRADRLAMLEEARALHYRPARPVVGEGENAVSQDFELTVDLPPGGRLLAATRALDRLVGQALARIRPDPLPGGFHINDHIVQRYAAGCAGMSPHRDHLRYVGLVLIVALAGQGRFLVCDDRSGRNAREIPARPGDLLLMRAPGLFGRGDRPFHFVRDIRRDRYILGLRHDSRPSP